MARGVNKVIIVGNLGADPEIRRAHSGTAIANLRVATTTGVKRGDQWEDATEWHRVVCFGRTAEVAEKYLEKGRQVYIEGRIQTRKWEDKDGNDRYSTEIVCNDMQMLGSRNDGRQESAPRRQEPARRAPPEPAEDFDDDIPF